jgi:hypothetical protein
MTRLTIALGIGLLLTASLAGAAGPSAPPGGPAPKALVGTYRTTLTRADIARAAVPAHVPTFKWDLVIVNAPYLKYKLALGFRPTGQGGDTVPFGVQGNRLNLQCLVDGRPAPGFGTYAFTLRGKTLTFRLVRERCKEPDLRNRIVILTSRPWKRIG